MLQFYLMSSYCYPFILFVLKTAARIGKKVWYELIINYIL